MLQYNGIDMSEGIDVNKTNDLRGCIICHYWYFLEINSKFQQNACDSCHDLMQKAVSFNDVATVFIKGNDYRIYFWYMSKDEDINVFADLTGKIKCNIIKNNFYLWCIKYR